jgi:hypothetical protein
VASLRVLVVETSWSTLADAGLQVDSNTSDAKIMIRRMCYDIEDFFSRTNPDYDSAWAWMKDNQKLWDRIKTSETRLDEACADKESLDIIKARCVEWKAAWKEAIQEFINRNNGGKDVKD